MAGRLATEEVKEMVVGWGREREGRMQGVMEPWQTRQYDCAGLSLMVPCHGAWKELVRGATWGQPGLCAH